MMNLRFGRYTIAIAACLMFAIVAATGIFGASAKQASGYAEQASSAISPSGEVVHFEDGSLSLPPSNGPGATPTGAVTAALSFGAPAGRPRLAGALAYFSVSSDATIDITGSFIMSLKPSNGSRCSSTQTDVAFLGASGWDAWQRHFAMGDFGCSSDGSYVATLTPQGRLRLAAGTTVVLALFKGQPMPL